MANTTIELKNSIVSGNSPPSLVGGEIAINRADGRIFYKTPSGTIESFERYSGPSGLNMELQFNDNGSLGASDKLQFNKSTGILQVSQEIIANNINVVQTLLSAYEKANSDITSININSGTIGAANVTPRITVEANGRISSITTENVAIDSSQIVSGLIATSRLGTGVANVNSYLRGDNTWGSVTASAELTVTDDITTNYNYYPTLTNANTSLTNLYTSSSKLYYNPLLGQLNATNFNSLSDKNVKENIKTIDNALNKVLGLRGVSFNWIDSKSESIGVIAQEVEDILPEVVSTNEYGEKSVNYSGIIGVLIEAIKEQQKEINELKMKVKKYGSTSNKKTI